MAALNSHGNYPPGFTKENTGGPGIFHWYDHTSTTGKKWYATNNPAGRQESTVVRVRGRLGRNGEVFRPHWSVGAKRLSWRRRLWSGTLRNVGLNVENCAMEQSSKKAVLSGFSSAAPSTCHYSGSSSADPNSSSRGHAVDGPRLRRPCGNRCGLLICRGTLGCVDRQGDLRRKPSPLWPQWSFTPWSLPATSRGERGPSARACLQAHVPAHPITKMSVAGWGSFPSGAGTPPCGPEP